MTLDELRLTILQNPTAWSADQPLSAEVTIPPNFLGFQGHFPNQPILPGFLHLQLALAVLRLGVREMGSLAGVPVAKFHQPILPGTRIVIDLWPGAPSQICGRLHTGDQTLSTFELEFSAPSSRQ